MRVPAPAISFRDRPGTIRQCLGPRLRDSKAIMLEACERTDQQARKTKLGPAYESKLLDHIADEEELLLAIFASRIESFPVGGSVEIFVNEHRKLQDYLTLFKHEFPKLRSASDPERAILFLLDSQTMFKKLLVHHDTREEKFLYPILDQVTTLTERVEIAKRMRLRVSETAVAAV